MGEIADDLIDRMSDDDFYGYAYYEPRRAPRCWQCGVTCSWGFSTARKWELYNGDKQHVCSERKTHARIADDFDVI